VTNNKNSGIRHLIDACGYSLAGLKAGIQNETAFRQELVLFVLLFPLGLWLGETAVERSLLTGSLFIVLIVELVNSAIETVVDRVGEERHLLSGRAKDLGSAAVFLALVNVIIIWLLILVT